MDHNRRTLKLNYSEYRLAELIWEKEPINSTELVKISGECLGWKKATVYTILRKLCEKGIVINHNAIVTSTIKKEQVQQIASEEFMERTFNNSVPIFLASFLKDKKLCKDEVEEINKIIKEALDEQS